MAIVNYPGILIPDIMDRKIDKNALYLQYVLYFLSQTQKIFKWDGLPDSIPEKFIESYLQQCGVTGFEFDGDELITTRGGWGGERDVYYRPKYFIIANPYVKNPSANGTKRIGEDCEIILNDSFAEGLMPVITKYSMLLTENEITLRLSSIIARAQAIISASDDDTKQSAELFIKKLFDGDLSVIGENVLMESLKISPLNASTQSRIKELIELNQYYFATFENRIGLQSNFNMKRERLNTAETALNEDILYPFIQNMLDERKIGAERVNAFCQRVRPDLNINISVSLNSSWQDNFRQKDLEIESLEQTGADTEQSGAEPEQNGGGDDVSEN